MGGIILHSWLCKGNGCFKSQRDDMSGFYNQRRKSLLFLKIYHRLSLICPSECKVGLSGRINEVNL